MPVKKPIEGKPSIKVEMSLANAPDGARDSAIIQIKILLEQGQAVMLGAGGKSPCVVATGASAWTVL